MGLFSKKKINFGELFPDPPQMQLDRPSYDRFSGDIDGLINTFEGRRNGTDQFDYLKFLFQPQADRLNYDFDQSLGDVRAGLNKRGILDSGVSADVEGKLFGEKNRQLSQLFGDSKLRQRADIDDAIAALGQLFPARFENGQVPNQYNYFNDMNSFNQAEKRNMATANQRATRPSGIGPYMGMIGQAAGSIFGGPMGGQIGGQIGNMIGGNTQQPIQLGTSGNPLGQYDMSNFQNLFKPGTFNSMFRGGTNQSFQPSAPPMGYNAGINPWGNMNKNIYQSNSSRVSSSTPGFSGGGGLFNGRGASGSW